MSIEITTVLSLRPCWLSEVLASSNLPAPRFPVRSFFIGRLFAISLLVSRINSYFQSFLLLHFHLFDRVSSMENRNEKLWHANLNLKNFSRRKLPFIYSYKTLWKSYSLQIPGTYFCSLLLPRTSFLSFAYVEILIKWVMKRKFQ